MNKNSAGFWILALLITAGLGWSYYSSHRDAQALTRELKRIEAENRAAMGELKTENAALAAINLRLAEQVAEAKEERRVLREQRARDTAEIDRLRADLATAPPEAVLEATQGYVNTTEIWLRANAVGAAEGIFSLAAFRLNADRLAVGHALETKTLPNLEAQLRAADQAQAGLEGQVSSLEVMIQNATVIFDQYEVIVETKDAHIGVLKKGNLKRDGLIAAGFFILGLIAGR